MKKFLMPFVLIIIFSCSKDKKEVDTGVLIPEAVIERSSQLFASITTLEEVKLPPDQIALGKMLYFDKRLSKNNTISCNSCHDLDTYGVDNDALSTGDTGELGDRNSPTSIYAFLDFKQFWDGRAETVEEQAGGPILNPVEHAIPDEKYLVDKLKDIKEYQEMFKKAYPEQGEPITYANLTSAIGAFERQLHPVSKFDRFLDGDRADWTQQEVNGLELFMSKNCISCHNGMALGGQMFQKFGLFGNYIEHTKSEIEDKGIYELTKKESDLHKFKVPGLRNIAKTAPYLHDGSVSDLKEVIKIMSEIQTDMALTPAQIDDIAAFLNTLTAEVDDKYKQ